MRAVEMHSPPVQPISSSRSGTGSVITMWVEVTARPTSQRREPGRGTSDREHGARRLDPAAVRLDHDPAARARRRSAAPGFARGRRRRPRAGRRAGRAPAAPAARWRRRRSAPRRGTIGEAQRAATCGAVERLRTARPLRARAHAAAAASQRSSCAALVETLRWPPLRNQISTPRSSAQAPISSIVRAACRQSSSVAGSPKRSARSSKRCQKRVHEARVATAGAVAADAGLEQHDPRLGLELAHRRMPSTSRRSRRRRSRGRPRRRRPAAGSARPAPPRAASSRRVVAEVGRLGRVARHDAHATRSAAARRKAEPRFGLASSLVTGAEPDRSPAGRQRPRSRFASRTIRRRWSGRWPPTSPRASSTRSSPRRPGGPAARSSSAMPSTPQSATIRIDEHGVLLSPRRRRRRRSARDRRPARRRPSRRSRARASTRQLAEWLRDLLTRRARRLARRGGALLGGARDDARRARGAARRRADEGGEERRYGAPDGRRLRASRRGQSDLVEVLCGGTALVDAAFAGKVFVRGSFPQLSVLTGAGFRIRYGTGERGGCRCLSQRDVARWLEQHADLVGAPAGHQPRRARARQVRRSGEVRLLAREPGSPSPTPASASIRAATWRSAGTGEAGAARSPTSGSSPIRRPWSRIPSCPGWRR